MFLQVKTPPVGYRLPGLGFSLPLYHGLGADEIVLVAPVAHQRGDCPVNSLLAHDRVIRREVHS